MRIVSLLPSLTEIVAALGLGDSIVGLTHSCDYPREAVEGKAIVTSSEISPYSMSQAEIHSIVCGALANGHSLYGLDAQLIEAADPDIILTQALCDVCAVSYPKVLSTCAKVLAGDEARPRVISIEPTTYDEVLNTILHVGEVCGALPQARQLVASLQAAQAHTVSLVAAKLDAGAPRPRVAFLEWTEPLFVGGHWVPGQIHAAGGEASYVESGARSRALPHEVLPLTLTLALTLTLTRALTLSQSLTLTLRPTRSW